METLINGHQGSSEQGRESRMGEQDARAEEQRNEREAAKALAQVPRSIKLQAQAAMHNAINRGELVRPKHCSRCGTDAMSIHGHHRSYEPHMWLLVEWLCARCHRRAHRQATPVIRKVGEVHCRFCKQVTHICPGTSAAMSALAAKRQSRKGNPRVLEALAKARAAKQPRKER